MLKLSHVYASNPGLAIAGKSADRQVQRAVKVLGGAAIVHLSVAKKPKAASNGTRKKRR